MSDERKPIAKDDAASIFGDYAMLFGMVGAIYVYAAWRMGISLPDMFWHIVRSVRGWVGL